MTRTCPRCGGHNLRFSRYRSPKERLLGLVGVQPVRCRTCRLRFSDRIWSFSDLRYAKCPKCFRMNLSLWSEHHYRVPAYMLLLLRLGGNPYRCEFCRHNFVSFRLRKERFAFRKRARGAGASATEAGNLERAQDPAGTGRNTSGE